MFVISRKGVHAVTNISWFFLKRLHERLDDMAFKVQKIHDDAIYPTRGSEEAGGYDLYSPFKYTIRPGETQLIALGIACDFPRGQVCIVKDRSSMAKKKIFVKGGLMDSDYRGEWKVILFNATGDLFYVEAGDRIAQFVRLDCYQDPVVPVGRVISNEGRGKGGFGSTGK